MLDILPCHILRGGVGAHVDAADVLADQAQHQQDHAAQQQQQRRGRRPTHRSGAADEVVDDDVDQI